MSEENLWNLILKLIGGLIVGFQIFLVIFMLLFSKEPAPADLSVIPMDYETWGEYLRNPVPFNETLFQTTCFIVLFSRSYACFSFLYLLSERGRRFFLPLWKIGLAVALAFAVRGFCIFLIRQNFTSYYMFMEYLEPEIIMLLLGYFLREAVRGGKRHRKSRETCGDFARQ